MRKLPYSFVVGVFAVALALVVLGDAFAPGGLLPFSHTDASSELTVIALVLGGAGVALVLASKKLRTADAFLSQHQEVLERKDIELQYAKEATLSVLKDLSVEKENIAAAKAKDDAILASIGDGVFVIDANGTIILFNSAAEKISGCPAPEAIGKKYSDILVFGVEGSPKLNRAFIEGALKGKRSLMAGQTVLIRKDGTQVPVADSAAPVFDARGAVQGVVVVFRDVTEERKIDRAKTEFVSLASHQLRTPPTIVKYYSEMLLAGDAGKLSAKQRDFVQEVDDASKRMIELVHGLLNVTRLELGTFSIEPEPVRMTDIVDTVLKDLSLQIRAKKIAIRVVHEKKDAIIQGDRRILLVIVENLLTNALKYTPHRGKISVTVGERNRMIEVAVSDTGCGIPQAVQGKIFTKMYRAPNAQIADPQGTGLGLYMVKSILDYLGGTIHFESQEGKGSTFTVALPKSGMSAKKGVTRIVSELYH